MRVLVWSGLICALLVVPAAAQVKRLPQPSRSEQQVHDINRAIARQQMQTRQSQQSQFEINQLRNELHRSQQFPSMTGPNAPGCARGSIGC